MRSKIPFICWIFRLVLTLGFTAVVHAQFLYTNHNDAIIITGYTGPGGNLTIPGTIDGLPVVGIGEIAFSYNTSLTSIIIPDTVTNIGDSAFSSCSTLTNITLPKNLTAIGNSVFGGCSRLDNLVIPHGVTSIGLYAFDISPASSFPIPSPTSQTMPFGPASGLPM
jgi:hypothetical protein